VHLLNVSSFQVSLHHEMPIGRVLSNLYLSSNLNWIIFLMHIKEEMLYFVSVFNQYD